MPLLSGFLLPLVLGGCTQLQADGPLAVAGGITYQNPLEPVPTGYPRYGNTVVGAPGE
jgi:hypothetical protein